MPNQASFRHIEAIIPTLPHFNDFPEWKEKRKKYMIGSLIKNPVSMAKPCGKKLIK